MMRGVHGWVPLLLAMLAGPAGAAGQPGLNEEAFTVFVSIPPQKYVVERVGGPRVDVKVLVPPGRSAETYEPSPRQMAELGAARIYFRVGMPFEDPLFRRLAGTLKNVDVVDTRQGVILRSFGAHACAGHADPHVWLDPQRVKIQAATVCEALCRADPPRESDYRSRLAALVEDLDRTGRKISAWLEPFQGRRFYVYHPAFGYLADAFGLVQVALEEDGREPGPRHLARLIEQARNDGARVLFMQPQHASRGAQAFAEAIGARIVALDPLAEDYLENLERMAVEIRASFETDR
jgi:zinc transport system substrate-binding protein